MFFHIIKKRVVVQKNYNLNLHSNLIIKCKFSISIMILQEHYCNVIKFYNFKNWEDFCISIIKTLAKCSCCSIEQFWWHNNHPIDHIRSYHRLNIPWNFPLNFKTHMKALIIVLQDMFWSMFKLSFIINLLTRWPNKINQL